MAHGSKAFGKVGRFKMRLNADATAIKHTDSWGVDGLLDVHAAIDEVEKDLNLTLRLHVRTHATEAEA